MHVSKPLRKIKILCLHGYRQDGNALRSKMGAIRKAFASKIQFDYVDAPHLAGTDASSSQQTDSVEGADKSQKSWYYNQSEQNFQPFNNGEVLGFSESVACLDDFVANNGPYDVLLGFSQGGAMAHMYLKHCIIQGKCPFKGIIINAGFESKWSDHQKYFEGQFDGPALIFTSVNDQVIPSSKTSDLAIYYKDPLFIRHEGGHGFPTVGAMRPGFVLFLDQIRQVVDLTTDI